jgi:hypothetical protein
MKVVTACLIAMLICSCHQATNGSLSMQRRDELSTMMDEYLQRLDPYHKKGTGVFEFRGPLTIEQVERELIERYKAHAPPEGERPPEAPSHYPGSSWTKLKGKYADGDELYACLDKEKCGVSQSYWYVLVHGDRIKALVAVWTN